MRKSPASPKPVVVGRYRYTKRRWRLLVSLFDAVGGAITRVWRTLRPPRIPTEARRILLVQLDHLGDAVLTSPLIARLRAAYPSAGIDVLASPSNREVFEADPEISRIWVAESNWFERRPGRFAMGSAVLRLGRELRGKGYDLGIDVRGDILTVIVLTLAGIPRRLGWSMGGGGFLLTDVAKWEPGRHEVRSRLAMLEPLGISSEGPARVLMHVRDVDRVRAAKILRESRPGRNRHSGKSISLVGVPLENRSDAGRTSARAFKPSSSYLEADRLHAGRFGEDSAMLAIHLGAGTAAKRWPVRHWRSLVRRFLEDGWRVVVVGGAEDGELARQLEPHDRLSDLTGKLAVAETAALLERADFFIGADSGPSHLAATTGIPSVVIFSGTNHARQWRPWSRRSLLIRNRVPCGPCHRKTCPLVDHPCLSGLGPEQVYRAARRWWDRLHGSEAPHAPL